MLRPFLFIGIGGSGGKTLRTLREDLESRLAEVGYQGDFPVAWQCIHIDVPTQPDGNDADLPPQLPLADYVRLVAPGINYRTIDNALTSDAGKDSGILGSLVGWRPDPAKVLVQIAMGAGQYRTLGRVIAVTNLDDIRVAIRDATASLQTPEVRRQLTDLSHRFGAHVGPTSVPEPTVVVVSSLAGGSGAGALLDVCDVLRATGDDWTDASVALLYAPDVFDHLDEQRRKGVQANALASISELLAGYWNNDGAGSDEFALLERAGIQPGQIGRRGPRYPFLVGGANAHVAFPEQNAVYRAMGKALAAWVVSATVQDQMQLSVLGNWSNTASGVPDRLQLKVQGQETPFNAIGFARVSLGRDRFLSYGSERLARATVERALRQHLDGQPADANREIALDEAVFHTKSAFVSASRLDERGEERNDIVDALKPLDRADRMRTFINEIKAQTIAGANRARPGTQWTKQILAVVSDRSTEFAAAEQKQRHERGRRWAREIQDHLADLVAQTIAREGLPVTERLLASLDDELDHCLGELPEEAANRLHWASQQHEKVSQAIGHSDDLLLPTNPQIDKAITDAVRCMEWRADAALRDYAVELIRDLRDNVIVVLRQAVRQATDALASDERPANGQKSAIAAWPEGSQIPRLLEPAPNEFLVEPVSELPDRLTEKILSAVKAGDPGGAFREAVTRVLMGTDDPTGAGQCLVRLHTRWIPHIRELQPEHSGATAAVVDVSVRAPSLLERARAWVGESDSAIGAHARESLRDYLNDEKIEPAELDARLAAFRTAFTQALDAAAPLADISAQALQRTHEKADIEYELQLTEIPFPKGSKAARCVEEVLRDRGQWDTKAEKAFVDGAHGRIDMFSVLKEPYQPFVFDSIVRPIASEWAAKEKDVDKRTEFWRWRRSRPLPHFIPVAPEVRLAMIRGWFTARLLNQVAVDVDRTSIFVPGRSNWTFFPHPLLGPPLHQKEYELLPALLESLPLALLDWNMQGTKGEEALAPYWRLRALGTDAEGGEMNYHKPHPELSRWIDDGNVLAHAPSPQPDVAGPGEGSWEERKHHCLQYLRTLEANYEDLYSVTPSVESSLSLPRVWELRADYRKVLGELRSAIEDVTRDSREW